MIYNFNGTHASIFIVSWHHSSNTERRNVGQINYSFEILPVKVKKKLRVNYMWLIYQLLNYKL